MNGTTVTGVKVFVTDFHAASERESSVANADGTGNFTAPNQPYFNYNQIVVANAIHQRQSLEIQHTETRSRR